MQSFVKRAGDANSLKFERAGLEWLRAGGVPVVEVIDAGDGWLELERLANGRPNPKSAHEFGANLARLHAAGASHFGTPPPRWQGPGWMGRTRLPLCDSDAGLKWGQFYGRHRLLPYLGPARNNGSMDANDIRRLEALINRLEEGHLDHPQPALVKSTAARIHGDLWSGNVMWGEQGVLIDPAAHGGHAETDLATLSVFGQPHLTDIYAGYNSVSPLANGYQQRIGLHTLHILVVHAALFGGAYGAETAQTAARYL